MRHIVSIQEDYLVSFEIVGEENVYVVDVGLSEAAHREEKYIAYGKYRNILERLHRHLEGNTYLFSNIKIYLIYGR